MTFFSDRLQSSGVGAILHSLVQTLLRLRLRPANPVQWILTELKAGRYYLEEQSFLLLLQQYVAHAAVAAESNDVDHPTMLAQLVVLCLSNFSAMFVRMHDRRLLDEQSRLTFAVLFADGFMWEQLPTERRLSSSGRDSLRLSEYLQTAGRALKYLACLRQTIVPDEKAEKAIFYSVLDLAEVVLKLRCFAAQGEIDSFGDSVICFDVLEETNETAKQKDVEGETGAALNYSLSMRSRRRLSVQYVIPMAPCTDGMGPTKRQTPLEVLDEMQRLSKSLLSACGFAEASVRFLVCDLPTPPRLQQDTMAALRIRWGPISEPSTLQAALRTTDHLEQQLQNGEHPSLRLHPHSVQRGRYRAPAADDSVCCQNGWCTALQRSLGSSAATTSSAAGDAEVPIADLAPPCVIFLPLPVASLVNAAPLLLVLGSCLCRTLSAALLTAVPTFRAPPVGGDTPSGPAPSTAGKSKKAGKDGGATAAAAPAASAAPSAPTPAAGATVTTPEGTAAARRDAFGDAYEVLFGGLSEAEPHTTTQQPSLFGILLDTSNIVPTISQRAAGVLLTAVLQDVLPLPTSGEKSTTSAGRSPYLSPMLAAFAMTWNPLLASHPDGSCWVRRALSVLGEDPHVDLPHLALFLQLRQQFASEVGLTFSTASTTVDLYASLHDKECDSLPHSMPLHSLLNLLPLAAPLAMGGGDHNSPASPMSPAGGGGSKQAKAGDKGGSGGNAATPAATPLQQAKPHLDQLRVALMGSAPSKPQQQQSATVGKRCLEFDRKLVELVTPLRRDPSLKEVATLCLKL